MHFGVSAVGGMAAGMIGDGGTGTIAASAVDSIAPGAGTVAGVFFSALAGLAAGDPRSCGR